MELSPRSFVRFLLESDVLRFGDFVTKSGRNTPYFINTGMFRTGEQLATLGRYYAQAIQTHFPSDIDGLYGPAYKGIPLVVATSTALIQHHNRNLQITFNRKEAKDHGEGGVLVGAPLDRPCRIVVVEDVITAGTAIRETMDLFKRYPRARLVGMVVSVDRNERLDESGRSALQMIEELYGIHAVSLINIDDLISAVADPGFQKQYSISPRELQRMEEYRQQYGAQPK